MSVFYIYILVDPRFPAEVRYVGRTKNPGNRFSTHLSPSKLLDHTHKNNWIKKLLNENVIPIIRTIEKCSNLNRETYWIRYYRSIGHDLTNANDGGDGQLSPSPETIEKISKKLKGRIFGDRLSDIGRRKISSIHKGRVKSKNERNNISKSQIGKKLKPETKLKLKHARLKQKDPRLGTNHSDETKAILSKKMAGENHPQYGKNRSIETRERIRLTKKIKMAPDVEKIKKAFSIGKNMKEVMELLQIGRATYFKYKKMI